LVEESGGQRTFSEIAEPIANAYGTVFSNLPSRKTKNEQEMYEIGRKFGELTLLVDAVRDAEDDENTGNFNAWRAAFDLPQDLMGVKASVKESFGELKRRVQPLSATAYGYVESAERTVINHLESPQIKNSSLIFFGALPSFSPLFADADTGCGVIAGGLIAGGCFCCSALCIGSSIELSGRAKAEAIRKAGLTPEERRIEKEEKKQWNKKVWRGCCGVWRDCVLSIVDFIVIIALIALIIVLLDVCLMLFKCVQ
jgi:hypothetical protein